MRRQGDLRGVAGLGRRHGIVDRFLAFGGDLGPVEVEEPDKALLGSGRLARRGTTAAIGSGGGAPKL